MVQSLMKGFLFGWKKHSCVTDRRSVGVGISRRLDFAHVLCYKIIVTNKNVFMGYIMLSE